MIKKISIIIAALLSNVNASDNSVCNSANFSAPEILKTWVAEKYQMDLEVMKKIEFFVTHELPENNSSKRFVQQVANNEGDTRYFGKTFFALESIQLPFLQFSHQISQNKKPIVLELACGIGLVTWKVSYSFENEGQIFANELSSKMLDPFDCIIKRRLPTDLQERVRTIPGDCFNIPAEHPELIENVDAIYVQNLEHFFNPMQHQQFLILLDTLLAKSGRAFLCAHTFLSKYSKRGNPIHDLYLAQKAQGIIYPGFIQYHYKGLVLAESPYYTIGEDRIIKANRPDDLYSCGSETLDSSELGVFMTVDGPKKVRSMEQIITGHFFTPTIYKNAIASHAALLLIDSYFMDSYGHKQEKFLTNSVFCGTILEKK